MPVEQNRGDDMDETMTDRLQRPGDRHCLCPGDKVLIGSHEAKGIVLSRFIMTNGEVRYAVDHRAESGEISPHIYGDSDLNLLERGFDGRRADADADARVAAMRKAAAARARAEELTGEPPPWVSENGILAANAVVRATRESIAEGIEALPIKGEG
jgi:hypothetical protein